MDAWAVHPSGRDAAPLLLRVLRRRRLRVVVASCCSSGCAEILETGHGGIVPVQGFAGLAPATCQSRPAWSRWLRLGTAWRRPRARAWRPVRFRARQWLLAYVELRALSSRRVSEPLNLSLQLRQFVGLRPCFGCLRFEIGFGQQGDSEMAAALEIKSPSNVGCASNRLFYKDIVRNKPPKEAENSHLNQNPIKSSHAARTAPSTPKTARSQIVAGLGRPGGSSLHPKRGGLRRISAPHYARHAEPLAQRRVPHAAALKIAQHGMLVASAPSFLGC